MAVEVKGKQSNTWTKLILEANHDQMQEIRETVNQKLHPPRSEDA